MQFAVRLADRIVAIRSMYHEIYAMCDSYIIQDCSGYKPDIIIETKQSDIDFEVKRMLNANKKDGFVGCYDDDLETLSVHRKIAKAMIDDNTLLIHGSVIATDGIGYMISAPSGVGKSTRTRLWVDNIPNTIVVNGDKPFVRITDTQVIAYGTPWCGKERWNSNVAVPLRAIFFLERAEGKESDLVTEINMGEAVAKLCGQIYQPPGNTAMKKVLQLIMQMKGKVRFFTFRSSPTPEAVRLAYGVANE